MGKIALYSKWALRIGIIAAAIYDLFILRWIGIAGGLAILLLTYLIDYINLNKKRISDKLVALFYIFCIFSLVLGVMINFYDNIFWWDVLMHVLSGVVMGIFGNSILNRIQGAKKVEPLARFIFIIGIACTGGLFWEIYEFIADLTLGIDCQKVVMTGVRDTMEDSIANLVGGILAGAFFAKFDRSTK